MSPRHICALCSEEIDSDEVPAFTDLGEYCHGVCWEEREEGDA